MKDNYDEMRAEAQALANKEGIDFGMTKGMIGGWNYIRLPRPSNRYGYELQCEVVRPEGDYAKWYAS